MRDIKIITIVDGENEYKFSLRKMGALQQSRWTIRLIILLAKSGLLDLDANEIMAGGDLMLDKVLNGILHKGFSFVGQMEAEEVEDLILDMVEKTAQRVAGKGGTLIKCDRMELDNLFDSFKALLELYKQVFLLNFPMLATANQQIAEQATEQEQGKGSHISIRTTSPQA